MSTKSRNNITVFIVDNYPCIRAGISALLSKAKDIRIVGEISNAKKLHQAISTSKPQILIIDIDIFINNSKLLKNAKHILVLSDKKNDGYLYRAIKLGALGYLHKSVSSVELIQSIRRIANKETLFSKEQLLKAILWKEEIEGKINLLTPREHQILYFFCKGLGNKTIATKLGISIKAATYHTTNILSKLQVSSRLEATVWAIKNMSNDLDITLK